MIISPENLTVKIHIFANDTDDCTIVYSIWQREKDSIQMLLVLSLMWSTSFIVISKKWSHFFYLMIIVSGSWSRYYLFGYILFWLKNVSS